MDATTWRGRRRTRPRWSREQAQLASYGYGAAALAALLVAATPTDDASLEAGIRALSAVLDGVKAKLPADAQSDQHLAEVKDLCVALQTLPGAAHTSKGQTVADTAQIDLYDGKLRVWMRDLNQAGRRAIRNGNLNAGLHEYVFHYLKRSGNASAPAAQPQPTPQPQPAAPVQTAPQTGQS